MLYLTIKEREILSHRLEVPDCIHDAIEMGTEEEVIDACDAVLDHVHSGRIGNVLSELEIAVLTEAAAGSTWAACRNNAYVNGELSIWKWGSDAESCSHLSKKLEAVGISVMIPID